MRAEDSEYFKPLTKQWSTPDFEGGKKDSLTYSNGEYLAKYATFRNIIFDGLVAFNNVYFGVGISFTNCTFENGFALTNIKASGFDKIFNDKSESIIFSNCIFKNIFNFLGTRNLVERNIVFEKCTFEKGFYVEHLQIELEGIKFDACNFKIDLNLNNIRFKSSITFTNCQLECFSAFFNVNGTEIIFSEGNTAHDNIHIKECVFEQGIIFNYSNFKKDVWLRLVTAKQRGLSIFASHFEKSLLIYNHWQNKEPNEGINSFYFEATNFQGGFVANGTEHLLATKPLIKYLIIKVSPELKGNIAFNDYDIGELNMEGFNTSTNILFNRVHLNQLKMKGFINNSGLVFSYLRASNTTWLEPDTNLHRINAIYIDNTNFGNAQLTQVNFSGFNKVVFHHNILSNISMSVVNWFSYEQLVNGEEKNLVERHRRAVFDDNKLEIRNSSLSLIEKYSSMKEVYRQLKLAYTKQGDTPEALRFQGIEMDLYRKLLIYKTPANYGDRFILWISLSNDFGQNWFKAMVWLMGASIIFYIPIGFLTSNKLDYNQWAANSEDWKTSLSVVAENFKAWFILLNPTHRIKDIDENIDSFSPWVYFWDFLDRIVISFFLFQMVSAFRKFHKK